MKINPYWFGVRCHGKNSEENLPIPLNPYARKPTTLTMAKTTMIIWDNCEPVPVPNLVFIHSAPVMTFERRSQQDRYTIKNIWLKTGQSHGMNTPLRP